MADFVNIFDKYGIKEVANVYFEALADEEKNGVYKGDIVLYLDTLKVSTIEQTAEQTDARGGWGNPKLITWDYGKEITITLEDALMSLESLRFMMGGAIKKSSSTNTVWVHRTEICETYLDEDETTQTSTVKIHLPKDHLTNETLYPVATPGHPIKFINYGGGANNTSAGLRTQITSTSGSKWMEDGATLAFGNERLKAGTSTNKAAIELGDVIRVFWDEEVTSTNAAVEVTISSNTFPGTYRVVGDTLIRSQKTGKDEAFQFIIERAKVSSEVTLTLEAEGDPSTFSMTLTVLRDPNNTDMMKLVRYGSSDTSVTTAIDEGSLTTDTSKPTPPSGSDTPGT